MKTLIIYTYPSPTGFNAAILKEVQSNLSKKHEVKILDLYAKNFDPILRFDHEHRRRDLHKDPEMANLVERYAGHSQGLYRPCLCG